MEDKLLAAWGVRFIQIKNYFAFYVVEGNQVTVIRFLYAKSDWVSIHSTHSLSARAPTSPQLCALQTRIPVPDMPIENNPLSMKCLYDM